ncbi:MAG: acyl-CoA dehydrogenase family protein [Deltaproteobacteria bacterium]|nr:acyl-CoA dehydrogenase family protein [Deltaproteobacteria bacterium]MBW2362182.1 acyl-CoA dehydrogenase family protein [Deltaproteobacteria bacterium]
MDFDFSPEEDAFRARVQSFLDAHLPSEFDARDPDFLKQWNRALGEAGWLGFAWPKEAGGGGATIIEQFILKEEMSARRAPPLGSDFMGLTWVGPALIEHGSDEQKQQFLPELLAGESCWCTGYSEPGAGSDLASLSTRAERDGDDYVVNGQKIWTTLAHVAKYIFMLVRTESSSRYGGITCVLIPMDSPGIEIQPIPNLSGEVSFNQVFFKDVRVPVASRLGKEGEGWRVVVGALANERSGISEATEKLRHIEDLEELARKVMRGGRPAVEDPEVRRKLASFRTRIAAMRLTGMRHLTNQLQGRRPSSETSINKLLRGQLEIEMDAFAMGLLGTQAQTQGRWQYLSLSYHGTVIGGGTPNIQRNIIAERILGLPKD